MYMVMSIFYVFGQCRAQVPFYFILFYYFIFLCAFLTLAHIRMYIHTAAYVPKEPLGFVRRDLLQVVEARHWSLLG